MANSSDFTQPGGSSSSMSEGPLRPGLVPVKVEYPFKTPPFYADQVRQVTRRPSERLRARPEIRVRQKRSTVTGVIKLFSRER